MNRAITTARSYQLPRNMSTFGMEHDWLYYFIYWAGMALFLAIVGLMLWFVFRYHRSRNPQSAPEGNLKALEILWTFSPLLVLGILFHWGFEGYVKGAVAPDDAIEIRVRGKQWLWEFEYPNGAREVGNLRVPVGRPVKLIMSSDDVLHSFYVPEFRWKKDVVPGQYSTMWFQATETGVAQVFCTEYCGTSHSGMMAKIQVVSENEYNTFLTEGISAPAGLTPAEWGKQLYTQNNCNTCHSLDGSMLVGPTWKGIWGRKEEFQDGTSTIVDENYIQESILKPQAKLVKGYNPVMPVYILQEKQIDALIAFMKTLK